MLNKKNKQGLIGFIECLSLTILEALYDACLLIAEDNFYNKHASRIRRDADSDKVAAEKEAVLEESFVKRNEIVKELFEEGYRTQQHWLEVILHILQREDDKDILDTIITKMSYAYYEVFKTIYRSLIDKENTIAKAIEQTNGNNGSKNLPDSKINNLRRLRSSMIARIEIADSINSQRKLNACMGNETNCNIQAEIVAKLIEIQATETAALAKIDWFMIETISKDYEFFNHNDDCTLKKNADQLLEMRKQRKNQQKKGTPTKHN